MEWYGGPNSGGKVGWQLFIVPTEEVGIFMLRHEYLNDSSFRTNDDEEEDKFVPFWFEGDIGQLYDWLSRKDLADFEAARREFWQKIKKEFAV